MKTLDIACMGYAVKTDVYEGSSTGPILLSLIGRTSSRKKKRHIEFLDALAKEQGITSIIFDYSGHGDSPFNIEDICLAQQFLEVITVFDWMRGQYPGRACIVLGSSMGGYQATQLTKYREFDRLILRAPAMYRPADFYTKRKNEDTAATQAFRADAEKLAAHPLLARASQFKGKTLLVVHERDDKIPVETTDAYANAFKPDVLHFDVPHSLDDATEEQVQAYFDAITHWIATTT